MKTKFYIMSRITNYPIILLILLVAAGILYSPSLRYPFIWDDMPVVRDNSYLRSPTTYRIFFQPSYWQKKLPVSRFDYRPLQMIALSAISRAGGRNPFFPGCQSPPPPSDLSANLEADLADRGRKGPALFATAFFAFHPVHVEAVVNARNISELMTAILLLAAFILFIRRTGAVYLFLSCLCFLLALLCKENALIFPALLTTTVLILKKETAREYGLRRTIPFWLIASGGVATKLLISSDVPLRDPPAIPAFIVGSARLIGTYLHMLIFPARLKVLYPFNKPLSWTEPEWFLSLLLVVGLFIVAVQRFKKGGFLSWAVACLLISLLPTLAKIGQIGRIVAEQRLYLPSIFFCIAGAVLLNRTGSEDRRRFPAATGIAAFIICLSFAGLTGEYLLSWRSNFSLWTRVTSLSPRAAIAYNNLAIAFHRRGNDDRAMVELETALRIDPRHKEARSNLGVLHSLARRWEAAIDEFKQSLESDPSYYPASLHLAQVYLRRGRLDEAEEILRSVLDQNPYLPEACNGLAIVLEEKGESREAEALYRKAAQLNHEYVIPLRNLAALYHERKEFDQAIEVGREAISKMPGHPNGYLALARVYTTMDRLEEARVLLREALRRNPDNWKIRSRLMALESVRPGE